MENIVRGGVNLLETLLAKEEWKNLQENNKRLGIERTCIRRKIPKTNKWNNKLQGVIKKLTLSFVLQI
jgi:hypothetical protein